MTTKKTTTSNIRATLAKALERTMSGDMPYEDGRNIIGYCNQISALMSAEVKVLSMKARSGHQVEKFGELEID